MGSLLCLPCKFLWKLIDGVSSFGTVFFCIPLSLFTLVVSFVLGCLGSLRLYKVLHEADVYTFSVWKEIIEDSFFIMTAVFAIFSVISLCSLFAKLAKSLYRTLLLIVLLNIIQEICFLIWKNTTKQERLDLEKELIYSCIDIVVILFASFWVTSCFGSLSKVLAAGGTGWECLNYKDVQKLRNAKLENQASSSTQLQAYTN